MFRNTSQINSYAMPLVTFQMCPDKRRGIAVETVDDNIAVTSAETFGPWGHRHEQQ